MLLSDLGTGAAIMIKSGGLFGWLPRQLKELKLDSYIHILTKIKRLLSLERDCVNFV